MLANIGDDRQVIQRVRSATQAQVLAGISADPSLHRHGGWAHTEAIQSTIGTGDPQHRRDGSP
jgi:hypothetical protein